MARCCGFRGPNDQIVPRNSLRNMNFSPDQVSSVADQRDIGIGRIGAPKSQLADGFRPPIGEAHNK